MVRKKLKVHSRGSAEGGWVHSDAAQVAQNKATQYVRLARYAEESVLWVRFERDAIAEHRRQDSVDKEACIPAEGNHAVQITGAGLKRH